MVYAWIIPIAVVAIIGVSGYLVYRYVIFDILANSSVNSTLKRYQTHISVHQITRYTYDCNYCNWNYPSIYHIED
jgi:hypothetical protein